MTTDSPAPAPAPASAGDERIVQELENIYRQVQEAAAAGPTPERSGVLNSLQLLLEPSVRAARLLMDHEAMHITQ